MLTKIKSLKEIDYTSTNTVAFDATVISMITEGDGEKRPFKFTVKLEESGETVTVVSWKFDNLDTVKRLAKTDDVYTFEGSAGKFGNFGEEIRVGNIRETGQHSSRKVVRSSGGAETRRNIVKMVDKYIKTDALKKIVDKLLLSNEDFFVWPAATRVHHNFEGGLAEHSYGVARDAVAIWENYKGENIDLELVVAGSLLHDIGKLDEYAKDGTRTIYGNLVSHPVSGAERIAVAAREIGVDPNKDTKVLMLRHIVLSHHGKYEFGAATLPYIPEAWIVHLADNTDAKMESINASISNLAVYGESERLLSLDGNKVLKWH